MIVRDSIFDSFDKIIFKLLLLSSLTFLSLQSKQKLLIFKVTFELFPDVKITIGPTIENGFYYDFDLDQSFSDEILEKIEKPDVYSLEGLPPSICIESRNNIKNSRSTVGTMTEIYDFIRIIFHSNI